MKPNLELKGLPGINKKIIHAVYFKRTDKILTILSNEMAATVSGDNGAINIWIDDSGGIRCEAMKFCKSLEYKIFRDIEKVKVWAKEWLKKIK